MSYFGNFIWGITLPVRASALILKNPKLWIWVLLPILVSAGAYYYVWADFFAPWQSSISVSATTYLAGLFGIETLDGVKTGLRILISVLLTVFFWIIALLTFSTLSNLITIPVNDLLAEATEPLCTPPLTRDYQGGLSAFLKAMWVDLRKSVASILLILISLFISWIPIMNIVAVFLVSLALALQYTGYASTRRGLGVRASTKLSFKHLPSNIGFGLACMALFTIPVLKLLMPSVAVVAGTMLYGSMLKGAGPRSDAPHDR